MAQAINSGSLSTAVRRIVIMTKQLDKKCIVITTFTAYFKNLAAQVVGNCDKTESAFYPEKAIF